MSEELTWQDRYKRAVLSYLIVHGSITHGPGQKSSPWDNGVGPDGHAVRVHLAGCYLDLGKCTMLEETTWTEWGGTFDSDTLKLGVLAGVTCTCGEIRDRKFQLDAEDMIGIINGVVSDDAPRWDSVICPDCGGELAEFLQPELHRVCQGKSPRYKSCGWTSAPSAG